MDHDLSISRSTSTTSSLDPYYFGIRSPSDSPIPPLPTSHILPSSTPEQPPVQDPVTPARDPATIDRRGLVGVGELMTPRWTRTEHNGDLMTTDDADQNGEFEVIVPDVTPDDEPDSPWTIEAIDSEGSDGEEVGSLIMACCCFPNTYYRCWMLISSPLPFALGLQSQMKVEEKRYCIPAI